MDTLNEKVSRDAYLFSEETISTPTVRRKKRRQNSTIAILAKTTLQANPERNLYKCV